MTLVMLFSDVHANSDALEAVLDRAGQLGATEYWNLGDTVGYGPDPIAVFEQITELHPAVWLAGNHDWMVLPVDLNLPQGEARLGNANSIEFGDETAKIPGPNDDAVEVSIRHRTVCSLEIFEQLAVLPVCCRLDQVGLPNIWLAHAVYTSGRNYQNDELSLTEYIKIPSNLERFYDPVLQAVPDMEGLPLLHASGHTHVQVLWERDLQTESWAVMVSSEKLAVPGHRYPLQPGRLYHINPGSVGFPRGTNTCPSFALLDTTDWTIAFHQIRDATYDSEAVRARMKQYKYPDNLWQTKLRHCD